MAKGRKQRLLPELLAGVEGRQAMILGDQLAHVFYVYSGFRKEGMFAGCFEVGFFAGEPTVNSEADAKAFAESRIGLDRVVIQVRTITQNEQR